MPATSRDNYDLYMQIVQPLGSIFLFLVSFSFSFLERHLGLGVYPEDQIGS